MELFFAVIVSIASLISFAGADFASDFRRLVNPVREDASRNILQQRATLPGHQVEGKKPRFLTENTSRFAVNGSAVPEVDFDIGESYAGLLPISGAPDESRQLFFWFFASTADRPSKEMVIWLNGGPGCSSLIGMLQENGPFLWQSGVYKPVRNPYSWTNLTNMLYVEQPVGVGFTQGTPNITNEPELAQQFVGFYDQFVKTFRLDHYPVYITGESYAGYYIPYIANEMIQTNDSNRPLKGISLINPIIAGDVAQQNAIIQPFADYWQNLLYLNQTTSANLSRKHEECGYKAYVDKYLQFPPPEGSFPKLPEIKGDDDKCDLRRDIYYASVRVNPCFDSYFVTDQCPVTFDVLSDRPDGKRGPNHPKTYFKRKDVQRAINAPVGTNWSLCVNEERSVFGGPKHNKSGEDNSLGPAQNKILARIIEHTNNVIIGSGNLDFVLPTNGTLLALQNVTWNCKQGFHKFPGKDLIVPGLPGRLGESGVLGKWGSERGLTFYQVQRAGHQLPAYAPGAAFRALEVLLGRVKTLGDDVGFTTAKGKEKDE